VFVNFAKQQAGEDEDVLQPRAVNARNEKQNVPTKRKVSPIKIKTRRQNKT
jgi:hypothetical protein